MKTIFVICPKFICWSSKMRENFVQIELNRTTWDVPTRYQNLSPVGSGAYGQVCWLLVKVTEPTISVFYKVILWSNKVKILISKLFMIKCISNHLLYPVWHVLAPIIATISLTYPFSHRVTLNFLNPRHINIFKVSSHVSCYWYQLFSTRFTD